MRINKLFSNYGICSRKETNKLIEDKRVIVNGVLCKPGQWVEEYDEILLTKYFFPFFKEIKYLNFSPLHITKCVALFFDDFS